MDSTKEMDISIRYEYTLSESQQNSQFVPL